MRNYMLRMIGIFIVWEIVPAALVLMLALVAGFGLFGLAEKYGGAVWEDVALARILSK